ncbi:hypothetical protein BGW38_008514, partial [Lunasporangiospora selenospora]
ETIHAINRQASGSFDCICGESTKVLTSIKRHAENCLKLHQFLGSNLKIDLVSTAEDKNKENEDSTLVVGFVDESLGTSAQIRDLQRIAQDLNMQLQLLSSTINNLLTPQFKGQKNILGQLEVVYQRSRVTQDEAIAALQGDVDDIKAKLDLQKDKK